MDADERLNRLVMHLLREDGAHPHLASCPDAAVRDATGGNGWYGCDTGCEYVRLEARVSCPHGYDAEFEYGEFGDMESLFEDMDRV